MLDARRQSYLDAMGIETFVRRESPEEPVQPSPAQALAEPSTANAFTPSTQSSQQGDAEQPNWEILRQRVAACRLCPELADSRTQTVFGVGNAQADWLIIGEAPGADEDRQGEPFVGRAGQLLNAMLMAMGLRRESVFIANILKCRPPGNRDPKMEEAAHCEAYLLDQIALIRPRILLAVGRIAAQKLLKSEEPLGRLRGRVHHFGEQQIPLVITYHPAYLLRSPEQKAKAWEDLQLALRTLSQQTGP